MKTLGNIFLLGMFCLALLVFFGDEIVPKFDSSFGAEACRDLFEDNFDDRVISVGRCNINLFEPDVFLIEYRGHDGKSNLRQCLVGSGYVRIPSMLEGWMC